MIYYCLNFVTIYSTFFLLFVFFRSRLQFASYLPLKRQRPTVQLVSKKQKMHEASGTCSNLETLVLVEGMTGTIISNWDTVSSMTSKYIVFFKTPMISQTTSPIITLAVDQHQLQTISLNITLKHLSQSLKSSSKTTMRHFRHLNH